MWAGLAMLLQAYHRGQLYETPDARVELVRA